MFFQCTDEGFHGLDRIEVDHHAAQFAHGLDMFGGKEFFFLAGAGARDIDGGKEAAIFWETTIISL